MSTDKPVGGDHRLDQAPTPEHKPFPGQSENRPHVPRPAGTKTPEQMRAERAQYKTTSEYLTAKAAEKTTAQQAAAKDTTAGAGTPGTPGAPGSGARDRGGAAPGRTPARGDTGGQHPAGTHDSGPATRPDAPSTRRADGLAHPDRTRRHPFPGQSENRPHVPRPAGTKTPEQMRVERAQYKTTSEYLTAKAAEKTAAKDAAPAKQPAAPKETPTAKPGTTTERGTSSRDQGRASGDRERGNAPARDNAGSGSTEKMNAARTTPSGAREHAPAAETLVSRADGHRQADSVHHASGHGSDHRPGQPGQHEGTSTTGQGSGTENTQAPGRLRPAHEADAAPRPDETTPQRQKDHSPPTEGTFGPHLSWTTLPPEARTVGDTTPTGIGQKPDGDRLLHMESDRPGSRLDRLLDGMVDGADDLHDASGNTAEAIDQIFRGGGTPSGHNTYTGHQGHDQPQPLGTTANDAVGANVILLAAAATGVRHMIVHHRRDHERDHSSR